jgi:hypothetical protein
LSQTESQFAETGLDGGADNCNTKNFCRSSAAWLRVVCNPREMAQLPDIATWDEDYLAQLPPGEMSWLDFKDSRWLTLDENWRIKASTYLSAFANYDGGYLVIGISDRKTADGGLPDGGVPENLKPGGIVPWLQNVLPSLVDRPLDRFDICAIHGRVRDSRIAPNHCVIALYVPPSDGAPHQARDGKYYTRHGSRLSFLGHRAVMDIIGRKSTPTIKVRVQLTWTRSDEIVLTVVIENTSRVLSRFCSVVVDLPVLIGESAMLSYNDVIVTTADGYDAVRVNLNNSGAGGSPLFPMGRVILEAPIKASPRSPHEFRPLPEVRFTAFADEMTPVTRSMPIEDVLVKL